MPKPTIKGLQALIETLHELRESDAVSMNRLHEQIDALNKRLALIAGENESLRQDKKWLQSMHSAVLQTMYNRRSA